MAKIDPKICKCPQRRTYKRAAFVNRHRNKFIERLFDNYESEISHILHTSEWSYANKNKQKQFNLLGKSKLWKKGTLPGGWRHKH